MLARLLPFENRSGIVHELTHMGHQAPHIVFGTSDQRWACKLLGVPEETAATLTTWLQHQASPCWWYSTTGAHPLTVDVIFGSSAELDTALQQAARHTPQLQPVVAALDQARQLQEHGPLHLALGTTTWALQQRIYIMGILNVTPDSFSDGGLYLQPEQALKHAEILLAEGADLIDVGGQSSRPGAAPVPTAVEHERVVPVVRDIVKRFNALVSVDTYRASVAAAR